MSTELDREWIALWNYAHKRRSRVTEQRIERLIRADADEQLNAAVSRATARILELETVLSRTERVLLSLHGHPFPENDQCPAAVVLREVTVALAESPSKVEQ